MTELNIDHGMSTACEILMDAGLWLLSPARRAELTGQIKARISAEMWEMIQPLIQDDPELDERIAAPGLVALWAELYLKPLTDTWLAAMAMHAYEEEGNDFAFGYLTAQLDRRRDVEENFIRGKKSVASGRTGADVRAKKTRAVTEAVLREMRRLVADGHTITRAATLSFRNGYGSSPDANRKLWNRHREK